jgi:hypothetical protein
MKKDLTDDRVFSLVATASLVSSWLARHSICLSLLQTL